MNFETFNPEIHDMGEVAQLVYDVDFRTFDMFYKNKKGAIKDISKMILKEKSPYFKVILENDEIIGIIYFYIHEKPSFIHSLLGVTSFKLLLIDILDHFVLSDVNENDLHIGMLAISDKCRGKGVGSEVLNLVIEEAKKRDFSRVTLDADFRNTKAKKLYEKIGFKEFNKKSVKIGKFERGMYNMEYVL